MKRLLSACTTGFSFLLLGVLLLPGCVNSPQETTHRQEEHKNMYGPADEFYLQRTLPDTTFALQAYTQALDVAKAQYIAKKANKKQGSAWPNWQEEGPGNIGGRINTMAVDENNGNVMYLGAAAGGLWKTTNQGQTWVPIFDDFSYLAIGDIEIDPNNSQTIYVGTGDPNIGGYPFIGDGVYKSTDAGATWTHLGLEDARIVSRVAVHPMNSDLVFAATMGLPFERNSDRGLYKSTDGGQNWQQVLFLSDSAGIIDLVLHPTDTNILYATGWNRIRNTTESMITGPESLIYKSTDGGQTWSPIMNGISYTGHLSRINLDIYEANPNILYASVIDSSLDLLNIYKSTDGGNNWSSRPATGLPPEALGGFGWYFGHVKVNPTDPDEIFLLGVDLWKSSNSGSNFAMAGPPWYYYDVHADKHDLVFTPQGIYLATDGGAYISTDGGDNWTDIENIPITQFYHVQVTPHYNGIYYGGAQDNGTMSGNLGNFNQWQRVYGGDGFDIQFHPTNSNIFYAETQNGGLVVTTDGGFYFDDFSIGISSSDRRNWDMPYKISYHDPDMLYCGTYRMYRTTNGAFGSWSSTSNDLTRGPIWGSNRNTISTIDESRTEPGYVYCGTSDGKVWRSADFANSWTDITGSLPFRYVTDVSTSYTTNGLLAVSHSGYKDNDFIPHIHLSYDHGDNWTDISGNLPPLAINDVELSPYNDSLIFVATDGGVYYTVNNGLHWDRLGINMPVIPVYDIEIDVQARLLIAGTHARSMMSIELDSVISQLAPPPLVIATSGADTICTGGVATVTVSGGQNVSWQPAGSVTCPNCRITEVYPNTTTTYVATVTDAFGTTATDSVTITVNNGPTGIYVQRYQDSLVAVVTGTASTYQWYQDNAPIPNSDQPYWIAMEDGAYQVEVSEADCSLQSGQVLVTISSAVTLEEPEVRIWASGDWLYAEMPGVSMDGHQLQVFNMQGQKVFSTPLQPGTTTQVFRLKPLAPGHYIVHLSGPVVTDSRKILLTP